MYVCSRGSIKRGVNKQLGVQQELAGGVMQQLGGVRQQLGAVRNEQGALLRPQLKPCIGQRPSIDCSF